jgi:hypothetical protein
MIILNTPSSDEPTKGNGVLPFDASEAPVPRDGEPKRNANKSADKDAERALLAEWSFLISIWHL